MMKKLLVWGAVGFVVLSIAKNPSAAAAVGRHIGAGVGAAASNLALFLTGVLGGQQ